MCRWRWPVREHIPVDAGGHATGAAGLQVTLRKASPGDADLLVEWRNADRERFGDTAPLTLEAHYRWWFQVYERDLLDHLYVVEAGGRPAGTIGVRLGERPEICRVLLGDKTLARTGVMTIALNLLTLGYGLPSCWLRVRAGNEPAVRFYERAGFRRDSEDGGWLTMSR
jgi:RimJ/RimL family protein N-acetyltransferase